MSETRIVDIIEYLDKSSRVINLNISKQIINKYRPLKNINCNILILKSYKKHSGFELTTTSSALHGRHYNHWTTEADSIRQTNDLVNRCC